MSISLTKIAILQPPFVLSTAGDAVGGPFCDDVLQIYCARDYSRQFYVPGDSFAELYLPTDNTAQVSDCGNLTNQYVEVGGEDTDYLQGLLDECGDVVIPAGTYDTGPLTVPACVTSITGGGGEAGTVLKLKDNAGRWARIFTIYRNANADSAIEISELTFNMNRDNQGWLGSYDLEHQSAIFLHANILKTGFLDANIHDVTIYDSAGDGITVYDRTRLTCARYTSTDVFRLALSIIGDVTTVNFTDSVMTRGGPGIEIGSGVSTAYTTCVFDGITCYDWNIILPTHGTLTATNITHTGGVLYHFVPPGAVFLCEDSTFIGRYVIQLVGDTIFTRCTFTGALVRPEVIEISWSYAGYDSDQTIQFNDCEITGFSDEVGIDSQTDVAANNNLLSIDGLAAANVSTVVSNHGGNVSYTDVTLDGNPWP